MGTRSAASCRQEPGAQRWKAQPILWRLQPVLVLRLSGSHPEADTMSFLFIISTWFLCSIVFLLTQMFYLQKMLTLV